jgi:hypothetical protein
MTGTKWNIETNSDLTAEAGTAVGLDTLPPETVAGRLSDRAGASYPQKAALTAPVWYQDSTATNIPGGAVRPRAIHLFWQALQGAIPAGSKMPPLSPTGGGDLTNKGSKGVANIGVGATNIYVGGVTAAPSLRIKSPSANTVVTGYWSSATPPVWVPIVPSTTYAFVLESCDPVTGVGSGVKSASLSVTTPATSTTTQNVTTPPGAPGGLTLTAPVPVIVSGAGSPLALTWNRVVGATTYEVWDNNTVGDDLTMDPANPGFNIGDVRINAAVAQPALPATQVTVNTPNYQHPGVPVRLKVRAIKTDSNGTAYSAFSPVLNLTIAPANSIPGVAPAPTPTNGSGHTVSVVINAPTISSSFPPPDYYKLFDGATLKATVAYPASAPVVLTYSGTGVAYSLTVVAGNAKGAAAASTAATGTTT